LGSFPSSHGHLKYEERKKCLKCNHDCGGSMYKKNISAADGERDFPGDGI
jgi:hypothetical protein